MLARAISNSVGLPLVSVIIEQPVRIGMQLSIKFMPRLYRRIHLLRDPNDQVQQKLLLSSLVAFLLRRVTRARRNQLKGSPKNFEESDH